MTDFTGQHADQSAFAVGGDGRRVLCFAFAIVALSAVYFTSAGPGFTEAQLAIATIFP